MSLFKNLTDLVLEGCGWFYTSLKVLSRFALAAISVVIFLSLVFAGGAFYLMEPEEVRGDTTPVEFVPAADVDNSVAALQTDPTLEQFRQALLDYTAWLEQQLDEGQRPQVAALQQKIEQLTSADLEAAYTAFPNAQELSAEVQFLASVNLDAPELEAQGQTQEPSIASFPDKFPFDPAYPVGPGHSSLVGRLPPGFVSGPFDVTRCDADLVADREIALTVVKLIGIGLQATCDATDPPLSFIFCGLAGLNNLLILGQETTLLRCELHDGFIDQAETESVFENSELRQIHLQATKLSGNLQYLLVTTMGGLPIDTEINTIQGSARNNVSFVEAVFQVDRIQEGVYKVSVDPTSLANNCEILKIQVSATDNIGATYAGTFIVE